MIFRRFLICAKSAYCVCHVRPRASIRADLNGRVFLKFVIGFFHENPVEKMHIFLKSDKNVGHLNEELSTLYFSGEIKSPKKVSSSEMLSGC